MTARAEATATLLLVSSIAAFAIPAFATAASEPDAPPSAEPKSTAPPSAEPKSTAPPSAEPKSTAPPSAEPKSIAPLSTEPKSTAPHAAEPKSTAPLSAEPAFIGQASCRACHVTEADHWATTVHARLPQRPRNDLEKLGCEGCHGPGSEHAKAPSERGRIVSFTRESASSVETMNGMCLSCHAGGTRIYWSGSAHERQAIACSDCHNPMTEQSSRDLLAKQSVSQTCFTCHPEQRAQFRKRSHMPLPEGKITCSDCHAPHGSATEPLLRADSVNQLCYQCHAEKRGPFLWEHAPVVENCLGCHHPHGSNHEGLLVSPAPFLCNQCHDQPGSFGHPNDLLTQGNLAFGEFPDERILNRGCVNCHVQIHGSNHPSGARFHR